ncbi:MAG: hypothetical protein IPK33_25810 [Gemmatimonadetes bacterium]|nr:hypothetical protein [Gemmatimonadota bacterium]
MRAAEPVVSLVLTDNWLEFTLRYAVPFDRRRAVGDRNSLHEDLEEGGGVGRRAFTRLASATMALVVRCPSSTFGWLGGLFLIAP